MSWHKEKKALFNRHPWLKDFKKHWDELDVNQKRIHLFFITQCNCYQFWKVCGRKAQIKYQREIKYTKENIDIYADELFNLYKTCLISSNVTSKRTKLKSLIRELGRKINDEEQNLLHTLESKKK